MKTTVGPADTYLPRPGQGRMAAQRMFAGGTNKPTNEVQAPVGVWGLPLRFWSNAKCKEDSGSRHGGCSREAIHSAQSCTSLTAIELIHGYLSV